MRLQCTSNLRIAHVSIFMHVFSLTCQWYQVAIIYEHVHPERYWSQSKSRHFLFAFFACRIKIGKPGKGRCIVATSWETGKLVLQLMFYLKVLFQNTWTYINWWLYIPELTTAMYYWLPCKNWVVLSLFMLRLLMKSQSHETKSSMELTGGSNIYDQGTRNWQH